MNVVLFGATGMVGQGVLLECLDDPEVKRVVSVVRRPTGVTHAKLTEIVHADFFDYAAIEPSLRDADACFFCLGVSSVGMKEEDYRHITYDLTMAAANTLHRSESEPRVHLCLGRRDRQHREGPGDVGAREGQDRERPGQAVRARVRVPAGLHPSGEGRPVEDGVGQHGHHGARPVGFLLKQFPGVGTSTDVLGRAMIAAVRSGAPSHAVEIREINTLGAARLARA